MSSETTPEVGADVRKVLCLAGGASVAVWVLTMARYADYSGSGVPNGESGSPLLFPLLAVIALAAGYFAPRSSRQIAVAIVAGPLVLAPFTTPKGDGDGLWGLIFVMLVLFGFVLSGCAAIGGRVRRADDRDQ